MALTKITGEGVGDIDSLTVDTNTLVVDAASNDVGIGTTTPNKSSSSNALTVNTGTAANYAALELSSNDTLNWYINANNAAVFDVTQGTPANALDDYEEGTWTPTLGGNTSYTSQAGRYTKIGRYVLADFDLTVNVLGTGSAGTLQGLPFNVENSGGVFSGHVSFYSGLALSVDSLDCYAIANTDDIFFTGHNSGAAASIGNNLAIFQNSTRVLGTVHYFAA